MASAALNAGDVVAGKYRIERVVGEGGMGTVLAAWHMELEQHVAIKLLSGDAMKNPSVVERFEREARAAVKIKSRHVARVSDVGKLENGTPYMVMEFLEGNDLELIMAKDGPLAIVRSDYYVLQACDAISEAHAYGIVHRDLKPGNLFLADQGGGSHEIKVLDFGISKTTGPGESGVPWKGLTHASEIFGSPMYMSPEQLTSTAKVDIRADVWSLGIILYELITGEPPFHEGTVAEIWANILHRDVPRPREKRPSLPEPLERAIMKALVRDPADRYQTVADFVEAIAPFGTGDAQPCVDRAKRFRAHTIGGKTSPDAAQSSPGVDRATAKAQALAALDEDIDIVFDERGRSVAPPPSAEGSALAPLPPVGSRKAEATSPEAPRQATPLAARTTTDWQLQTGPHLATPSPASRTAVSLSSVPPPARSRAPVVVLAIGVVAALGATAYFTRSRGDATPAPTSSATSEISADATASLAAVSDEPPTPTEPANAKHPALGHGLLLGKMLPASASALASSSAAPASSADSSASAEPAAEPTAVLAPEPVPEPPPPPTPDPLKGAKRKAQ